MNQAYSSETDGNQKKKKSIWKEKNRYKSVYFILRGSSH